MRWPTINEVRRSAKARGARGMIVLMVDDDGRIGGASYGRSKRDCAALGELLDAIVEGVCDRDLPAGWMERRSR